MAGCCDLDLKSFCKQVECKIEETDEGVNVKLNPKDKSKTSSFKTMIKGCQDFCDCGC